MTSRYSVEGSQGAYEPGSGEKVLANKLHLISPEDVAEAELVLLGKLYESVIFESLPDRQLTVMDVMRWHQRWLGNLYPWAGQIRSVNLGKDGFLFAAAHLIPQLLDTFETDILAVYTPCHDMTEAALVEAIAITHVEFILVHPFREGNGRLSRLLADVMAVQAGYEPLNYSSWDANREQYFGAIRAGQGMDYAAIKTLVHTALASTD